MKQFLSFLLFILLNGVAFSQQISVGRIDNMSNLPSPYLMRDWKQVATDYDNFVFNTNHTGTYLPLTNINPSAGINFSEINHIRMDTYVGQNNHGNIAEGINIIPAIVGASLVGVDKTNHLSVNWVAKVKDFFNAKNGQNVYLNNYSASTGHDWWYELMPNIYFYQLLSLYPNVDPDFDTQFITIANRQLEVVYKLGGNLNPYTSPDMNYRAFNLLTGLPLTTGVKEPESAGSIAWLLHQAYLKTNDEKYRYGAELALHFLSGFTSNPSYELQLPYGILAAARMNAEIGTNFDIEKMMNWTFSKGTGTLRGWGCIVGSWNGYDMSGLIGEAHDNGNDYAFVMNGFQHAAALAPVAKYDKRFAKAIGKWMLHLASASRYFYWDALPQANQESASYAWASQYDTEACIPYEAIKQSWQGTSPVAMGDAARSGWASTDLSLYSGSSVGYMASLIETTTVSGILRIDLNKTDFEGNNQYPSYLYYNPHATTQSVSLTLPAGNYDLYDAISESVIATNVSGTANISIAANSAVVLVAYPAGSAIETNGRIRKVQNGGVIDFHYNYDYTNPVRIKAFSSNKTVVTPTNNVTLTCLAENNTSTLSYEWYLNSSLISSGNSNAYTWTAPTQLGDYVFSCKIKQGAETVSSHDITIKVLAEGTEMPVIDKITFSGAEPYNVSSQLTISVETNTPEATITWECSGGTLQNDASLTPVWTLPAQEGIYEITLTLQNAMGSDTETKQVLVKDLNSQSIFSPIIYYPFTGDTQNAIQNQYNAVSVNAVPTTDVFGKNNSAYRFSASSQYIYTPNEAALNFTGKVAVAVWVKPDVLPANEQFIISHGSWEERYKLSIIDSKQARWTLKTNQATVDIDDPYPLQVGRFVHYVVQYTGYSLEMYRNGALVAYKALSGNIGTTNKSITLARKDTETTEYNFRGTLDEVRIFNTDLSVLQIEQLPDTLISGTQTIQTNPFNVFPNPYKSGFYINGTGQNEIQKVEMLDMSGRVLWISSNVQSGQFIQPNIENKGFYILKITTRDKNMYLSKILKI